MLITTEAIILSCINYTDNSVIVKLFTRDTGFISAFAKGVHGKKAGVRKNILQPGAITEVVIYSKENSSLKNIKEVKIIHPYTEIPFNPIKSAIVFFSSEFFQKVVKENEINRALYDFLRFFYTSLDSRPDNFANFPLVFLIKLSSYLGFAPSLNYSETENNLFNLNEGFFTTKGEMASHHFYADAEVSKNLSNALVWTIRDTKDAQLGYSKRQSLLQLLMQYYAIHTGISNLELKSIEVLKDVLR